MKNEKISKEIIMEIHKLYRSFQFEEFGSNLVYKNVLRPVAQQKEYIIPWVKVGISEHE